MGVFSTEAPDPHGQIVLSHPEGIIALLAANLFVLAFGVSWGPCVWVLLGEIFSNRVRGAALAVAVFAQWIAHWAVTVSFPVELNSFGPGAAYGAYLFFAAASIFFVSRKVRETRGQGLEQM